MVRQARPWLGHGRPGAWSAPGPRPGGCKGAARSGWCKIGGPACRASNSVVIAISPAAASVWTSSGSIRCSLRSIRLCTVGWHYLPSALTQTPLWKGGHNRMIRLSDFTPRMWLILTHDLLMTAVAVVAAFYLRFGESGVAERWPLLIFLLPAFVIYSAFVFTFTGMFKGKWRFTSVPDLITILRAATVQALTLLVLDYILLAPNVYGTFFFGKITIVLYWFLQVFFLAGLRIVYRYFRYTRTLSHIKAGGAVPTLTRRYGPEADVPLRALERGALPHIRPVRIVSPSRSDRRQAIRGVSVLGELDDLERIVADLGARH